MRFNVCPPTSRYSTPRFHAWCRSPCSAAAPLLGVTRPCGSQIRLVTSADGASHHSDKHVLQQISNSEGTAASLGKTASPLHGSFMGSSTRIRMMSPPLTRADLIALEKESLGHCPPGRINDHVCIVMVKGLRWIADRLFRERYIHRATMLKTISSAGPSAAAVVAYLSMMGARRQRLDEAPFVQTPLEGSSKSHRGTAAPSTTTTVLTHNGNHYSEELRGLLSQAECHAVHYQILVNMAEISPVERAAVLLLQIIHFTAFTVLFVVYPRMGFRLLGYLAEESSVVWTQMINDIDLGKIGEYHVPELAMSYWGLRENFTAQQAPRPEGPTKAVALDEEEFLPTTTRTDAESPAAARHEKEANCRDIASPNTQQVVSLEEAPADVRNSSNIPPEVISSTPHKRDHSTRVDLLTLRDVVLLIRTDEMTYRDLNHQTSDAMDRQRRKERGPIAKFIMDKTQMR